MDAWGSVCAFRHSALDTLAPFGTKFNAIKGGIYAMDWAADHISMYFFPRDSIPEDITNEKPNPATWGTPAARLNGGPSCDITSHFQEHNLIFNTDFCGDWAGSVWQWDKRLTALSKKCEDFAGATPRILHRGLLGHQLR
ncbi:putative endo-1 3(4)-beta-glucanase [Ceratocystis lukuohia]|uniref:Endo-1 3(4)-beta-glucanase n=1 Tax=Ceratocystis lukuohia TaxID=2019550 RepID=A0ABR4MQD3_9PEZI